MPTACGAILALPVLARSSAAYAIDATHQMRYFSMLLFSITEGENHECAGIRFAGCLHDFLELVRNEQFKCGSAGQAE